MEAESRNGTLVIRPMSMEDIGRVHAIDLMSFSMPWSERSYRFELTENRNAQVLVAEIVAPEGREVVGMIVVWVILDEAHIATIATHPDYRGRKIGRKLLANGLLAAYNRGARLAYLEVRRSNLTAQSLYEKFGFYVAGERPRYYKDNSEDALLMTLDSLDPEMLSRLAE